MKGAKAILISLLIISGFVMKSQAQIFVGATEIDTNSIITNLDTPWEILWGPDDHIWVTERNGKISRLNPEFQNILQDIETASMAEQQRIRNWLEKNNLL